MYSTKDLQDFIGLKNSQQQLANQTQIVQKEMSKLQKNLDSINNKIEINKTKLKQYKELENVKGMFNFIFDVAQVIGDIIDPFWDAFVGWFGELIGLSPSQIKTIQDFEMVKWLREQTDKAIDWVMDLFAWKGGDEKNLKKLLYTTDSNRLPDTVNHSPRLTEKLNFLEENC